MADSKNPYNEIVDTDGNGKVSGKAGNDKIVIPHAEGTAYAYGGAGNDTFMFKASSFQASDAQDDIAVKIHDFGGAGGWSATNNDFLHFSGFGAGSSLTLDRQGAVEGNGTLYYYTLHDTATNLDYHIVIKSLNGKALGQGDYNFY